MKKVKGVLDKIIDFIETEIPAFLLAMVVVGFFITIVYRYIFLGSIPQLDEIIVIAFTWMSLFCAPKGVKTNGHVSFTLLYDSVSKKTQKVMDILSALILLVCLAILFGPSVETTIFYGIRRTSTLHFSFTYLYIPFLFFLAFCIYHTAEKLYKYIADFISERRKN